MWSLKYEFRHKDCKYLPKAAELNVAVLSYPINSYIKNNSLFVYAVHIIKGKPSSVQKYIKHIKKISLKTEVLSQNTVFTLAKMDENIEYYKALYNQFLFFPAPILHEKDKEHAEIFSWEREHLVRLLNAITKNKDTEYFKLLAFKQKKIKNLFLMKAVGKMTKKQRLVFEYAQEQGYYNYPRKINLPMIAKNFKISKSTAHEILRRAETNLIGSIV